MAELDEFDDLDSAALAELDAIEARLGAHADGALPPSSVEVIDPDLEALLEREFDREPAQSAPAVHAAPAPPHCSRQPLSPQNGSTPSPLVQQGLFGHAVTAPRALPRSSSQTAPVQTGLGLVSLAADLRSTRTKVWDNYVYVACRNRAPKASKDAAPDAHEPMPHAAMPPSPHAMDREAMREWIYPVNKPLRSYQLNIVRKALFHNVLVALPTGLGKTFIAAVVILNLFRWFPRGKIIFVAPTRPLVAQQQQACHAICGLPWDTAIELTGSTRRTLRDDEWQAKRIFYMTPQTFENDLLSSACDARDVVCVVVDEAHHATGNYAYTSVIRHLMYHNPHFRVLALTATPGNSADKVQDVVDNLHIDHIEIRTEDALDIKPYIKEKSVRLVVVRMPPAIEALRVAWVKLMHTFYDPLEKHGIVRSNNVAYLRSFAVLTALNTPGARELLRQRGDLRHHGQMLAKMAHALQYLAEQSVRAFHDRLQELCAPGKGRAPTQRERIFSPSNPAFRDVLMALEDIQRDPDLYTHPKMHHLRDVLLEHFDRHRIESIQRGDDDAQTRAMVFCSYREVVSEIVAALGDAGLRATAFIGQASDSKGNRGYTQRQQEQVVREFQRGTYQVLVATSIGEEGLDIGEIDLIVCYDAVRDSVRGLQRVGRTGRERDGHVVVLMSEGREENNWEHSKASYKAVQRLVRDANLITLYTDVPRLVPDDVHPEPVMREVEQPAFDPASLHAPKSEPRRRREPKKPRGQAPPRGALLPFCSAADKHRHDMHREGAVPDERPHTRSSSSLLLRSSSLNGTANLSDDSDDAELAGGCLSNDSAPFSWSSSAPRASAQAMPAPAPPSVAPTPGADASPRFAPHPLVAELGAAEAGAFAGAVRHAPHPLVAELARAGGAESPPLFFSPPKASHGSSSPLPHTPASPPQRRKRRRIGASPTSRLLFQHEAERETDSEAHGESDEDDEGPSTSDENDEDRAAVGDFAPTQEPGYNQQAVYLQSMLSQGAPTPFRPRDRLAELLRHRDALRPSSEDCAASVDEYSEDSFVVGDDEIEWAHTQSSLSI